MLFLAFFSFLPTMSFSQDKDESNDVTMHVLSNNSKEVASYSLDDLKKITFSDKGIQIWHTQWPTEYSYNNVHVLSFNGAIEPSIPNSIRPVISVTEEQIFDLQGRKQTLLKKGVNIIRMKDGSMRKVLIK